MQNQWGIIVSEHEKMCACDFIRPHEYDLTENISFFALHDNFRMCMRSAGVISLILH